MNLMNITFIGFTLITDNVFVADVISQPPKWITRIFTLRSIFVFHVFVFLKLLKTF